MVAKAAFENTLLAAIYSVFVNTKLSMGCDTSVNRVRKWTE